MFESVQATTDDVDTSTYYATTDGIDEKRKTTNIFESVQATAKDANDDGNVADEIVCPS